VLAARRADRREALAAELPRALVVPTDVTLPEQVERLVARCLLTYGPMFLSTTPFKAFTSHSLTSTQHICGPCST
jgi:hypothetical protein